MPATVIGTGDIRITIKQFLTLRGLNFRRMIVRSGNKVTQLWAALEKVMLIPHNH